MSVEIDWEEQWSLHAHDFHSGKAHIPLTETTTFKLEPGPGFGDFSHPTTRLMIQMMRPFVASRPVLDIGCGSGILSVSAALLGSPSVYICDIDPKAIEHAKQNGLLNQVELKEEKPLWQKPLVLMNMITSEQKQAWATHSIPFFLLITSGILKAEKEKYLAFAHSINWQVYQEFELEDWLGFIFKENLG